MERSQSSTAHHDIFRGGTQQENHSAFPRFRSLTSASRGTAAFKCVQRFVNLSWRESTTFVSSAAVQVHFSVRKVIALCNETIHYTRFIVVHSTLRVSVKTPFPREV